MLAALIFDLVLWAGDPTLWTGDRPISAGLVAVVTVGVYSLLLIRRQHPVATFISQWVFSFVALMMPAFAPFAGLLLALYAAAAHSARRPAVLCITMCMVPFGLQSWKDAAGDSPQAFWFSFAFLDLLYLVIALAVWVAGRFIYAAEQTSQELQREHEAASIRALRTERLRIASELHDSVSHAVTAMLLQAAGAKRLVQPDADAELAKALEAIEDSGTHVMAEMHRLLRLLRVPVGGDTPVSIDSLEPQPTVTDIEALVEKTKTAGISIERHVTGSPGELDPTVSLAAYRVAQEALTNVVKHAGTAAHVDLGLTWRPDELTIEIRNTAGHAKDNRSDPRLSAGYGLIGLKERVRVVGGQLDHKPDEHGFIVRATLPRKPGPRQSRPMEL